MANRPSSAAPSWVWHRSSGPTFPQIYLDVDRTACMIKGVELRDVFMTLQAYLGSLYVNDFNRFGRTWQVIVQADAEVSRPERRHQPPAGAESRREPWCPWERSPTSGEINGPLVLTRYNMYPAASINGNACRKGSARALPSQAMQGLANRELPQAMSYEWTEMAYLELQAGNTAIIVFAFSIVMVFLVLAAQFESWAMPLAVILSVPLCMLERALRRDQRQFAGRPQHEPGHQHLHADRPGGAGRAWPARTRS